jgi:hypothetical protein
MHVAWLFNWAGKPWLTQKWARAILDSYYGHNPADAYLGDKDQGQMSAWFVMSAMGLLQTDGGCRVEPIYELGSPLYPKVVLHLSQDHYGGSTFKGCVVHELCHVLQNYRQVLRVNPQATLSPAWVTEGLADYIRWFLYEPRGAISVPSSDNEARKGRVGKLPRLESRMREIRPSGSEGGVGQCPIPPSIGGPGILPGASYQAAQSAKSTVLGRMPGFEWAHSVSLSKPIS